MQIGKHAVVVNGKNDRKYVLNRFYTNFTLPRPESYREDSTVAKRAGFSPSRSERLYADLAAAAESGWDFSSRWFADAETLETTQTTDIIPADLNGILYRVETILSEMHAQLGNDRQRDKYKQVRVCSSRAISRYK